MAHWIGAFVTILITAVPSITPQSRVLKVTTIANEPYLTVNDQSSGSHQPLHTGFVVDLLEQVKSKTGFDYTLDIVKDRMYGSIKGNGSWSGMIGELVRGEADIAVADLTVTASRAKVVDFTPATTIGSKVILGKLLTQQGESDATGKEPKDKKPRPPKYLLPRDAYITIVVLEIVTFAFFVFCFIWHPKDRGVACNNWDRVWYAFTTFLLQGLHKRPKSTPLRILAALWASFVLQIILIYLRQGSYAVAYRRDNKPNGVRWMESIRKEDGSVRVKGDISFVTFEHLAETQHKKVYAVQGGSTWAYLKTSQSEVYQKLYKKIENDKTWVRSTKAGVDKVREDKNGNTYFIIERSTADHRAGVFCDVHYSLVETLQHVYHAIAMKKSLDNTIKDKIRIAVLQLQEDGTLAGLYYKYFIDHSQCGKTAGTYQYGGPVRSTSAPQDKGRKGTEGGFIKNAKKKILKISTNVGPYIFPIIWQIAAILISLAVYIIELFCCPNRRRRYSREALPDKDKILQEETGGELA